MITQREVDILTDAIKKYSGLEVPPHAAVAALYAVAYYKFRLIPRKLEPRKYVNGLHEGGAEPEPDQ